MPSFYSLQKKGKHVLLTCLRVVAPLPTRHHFRAITFFGKLFTLAITRVDEEVRVRAPFKQVDYAATIKVTGGSAFNSLNTNTMMTWLSACLACARLLSLALKHHL
jgi:hypothetical protein